MDEEEIKKILADPKQWPTVVFLASNADGERIEIISRSPSKTSVIGLVEAGKHALLHISTDAKQKKPSLKLVKDEN